MATKRRTHLLDLAITALAERQHGVLDRRQLFALGLSPAEIHTRVAAGRLHRLHRGVYSIVPPRLLRIQGHWKAATLAVGDGALLSHRAGAAHWGLLDYAGNRLDVTVARRLHERPGLTLHCCRVLPEDHADTKDAIPVTSVARTIADLAATQPQRLLERAIGQAEVLRVFDLRALEAVIEARPRAPGTRNLRALLVQPSDPASLRSRSPLEERLLALCRDAGIELPELNAPFTLPDGTPIEIDALWRRQRLAVETDSPTYHSAWPMQVSDRHRDQQLTLAGYKPLRLVDEDLEEREGATTAMLRRLVEADPPPG